jgi:epoxyqueuosine reductase
VSDDLKARLLGTAGELGFCAAGTASIAAPPRGDYFLRWLAEGRNASMEWLARNNDRRLAPENFLPGARSVVVLGFNYHQPPPVLPYRVARYALGADYHNFLLKRLKKLCARMREWGGEQRPCVDTAPVMEKPLAERAGLGWQGKNTLVTNRRHGPWLLLGAIFTTLEIPPDAPETNRCGACRRCAGACPTGALDGAYHMDARRCLAYLTVEHDGAIPPEFRAAMGDRLFGCDTCAEACPFGSGQWPVASGQCGDELRPRLEAFPQRLRDSFAWTDADYAARFAGSPLKRLGLRRWLRNCCVVLGNTGGDECAANLAALEALRERAAAAGDELLAEHAAWAVSKLANTDGKNEKKDETGKAAEFDQTAK